VEPESAAIGNNNSSRKLYVIAKTGLKLREKPGVANTSLASISYDEELDFLEEAGNNDNIEGRAGSWWKVKYKDKIGYVFNGFVNTHRYNMTTISDGNLNGISFISLPPGAESKGGSLMENNDKYGLENISFNKKDFFLLEKEISRIGSHAEWQIVDSIKTESNSDIQLLQTDGISSVICQSQKNKEDKTKYIIQADTSNFSKIKADAIINEKYIMKVWKIDVESERFAPVAKEEVKCTKVENEP
jgi:hypothetical protein